ncbi:MAG TPA: 50S ribosomal protein L32 [Patescibacteria group bacterium]|nr:50S ribosomal protein L32 [Patescibacteria group bacterium]
MSTPTQKHTKSRKNIRRGPRHLKKISLGECPKCKKPIRPHTACAFCGSYKGQAAVKVRVPKSLRKAKKQEKPKK